MRVSLSRVLPKFTVSRAVPLAFAAEDIRLGSASLTVDLNFDFSSGEHHLLLHKPKASFVSDQEGSVREGTFETPEREDLSPPNWPEVDPSGNLSIGVQSGPLIGVE